MAPVAWAVIYDDNGVLLPMDKRFIKGYGFDPAEWPQIFINGNFVAIAALSGTPGWGGYIFGQNKPIEMNIGDLGYVIQPKANLRADFRVGDPTPTQKEKLVLWCDHSGVAAVGDSVHLKVSGATPNGNIIAYSQRLKPLDVIKVADPYPIPLVIGKAGADGTLEKDYQITKSPVCTIWVGDGTTGAQSNQVDVSVGKEVKSLSAVDDPASFITWLTTNWWMVALAILAIAVLWWWSQ